MKNKFNALSLAQHFEAPDDYIGHFGWLCSYSASSNFFVNALERFTRQTQGQRASQGKVSLVAMLDPTNVQISAKDVAGLLHLGMTPTAKSQNKYQLLHAKVAILCYHHAQDKSQWLIRLLVSTGNWTEETLTESMDLVWTVDVSANDLAQMTTEIGQNCSDIQSAWSLFSWLLKDFNTELLNYNQHSETYLAMSESLTWLENIVQHAQGTPRFIDNRKQPLFNQLQTYVKTLGAKNRNYLALGSGFFESQSENKIATVPSAIASWLKDNNFVTQSCEMDIFVNPKNCQSISLSFDNLVKEGFKVRPAMINEKFFGKNRHLHAKFIFSANYRENSNRCNNAWIYLGSGNLSQQGFMHVIGSKSNLEAGIIQSVENMYWEEYGVKPEQVITNQLPIGWEEEISCASDLQTGSDDFRETIEFLASPISYLIGEISDGLIKLHLPETMVSDRIILQDLTLYPHNDETNKPCSLQEDYFIWGEEANATLPREVLVSYQAQGETFQSLVPVIDEFGRIAGVPLQALELEDSLWQLLNFPMAISDDISDEQIDTFEENFVKTSELNAPQNHNTSTYPIRSVMQWLESIADKQTKISQTDWQTWCFRLFQTLSQTKDSQAIAYFRKDLGINPLSVLLQPAFRPDFAEDGQNKEGKQYEKVIQDIEKLWQVENLAKLGA